MVFNGNPDAKNLGRNPGLNHAHFSGVEFSCTPAQAA
jgi:hypothetical protein